MIKEVCGRLKDKRKELGYSLEYTVEKTKLYPSVIKDIEAGKIENINAAYVKGFLKIYADFLDVDLGTALEEVGSSSAKTIIPPGNKNATKVNLKRVTRAYSKLSPLAKKRVAVALAALILLWVVFNIGKLTVKKVSSFVREKTTPAEEAADKNESLPVFPEGKDSGITVVAAAKKDCFLRVISDGKIVFRGLVRKGDVETWTGSQEVEFKINDGSAIELEINGKPIPTLASTPKPIKSLKIKPSGISVDK